MTYELKNRQTEPRITVRMSQVELENILIEKAREVFASDVDNFKWKLDEDGATVYSANGEYILEIEADRKY